MKLHLKLAITSICLIFFVSTAYASNVMVEKNLFKTKNTSNQNRIAAGVRWHNAMVETADYPFDNGDMSYGLYYEYHSPMALWQFGLNYASSNKNDSLYDDVYTPEINLIFKDKIYRLGVGVLKNYVTKDNVKEWGTTMYQLCTGIEVPLFSKLYLNIYGYYIFDDWGNIQYTKDNSFEYSATLGITF